MRIDSASGSDEQIYRERCRVARVGRRERVETDPYGINQRYVQYVRAGEGGARCVVSQGPGGPTKQRM